MIPPDRFSNEGLTDAVTINLPKRSVSVQETLGLSF